MSNFIRFRFKRQQHLGNIIEDWRNRTIFKNLDLNKKYRTNLTPKFFHSVAPGTVKFFTGRTDDGGDDLYEDDIISFDYELKSYEGVIQWSEALSAFVVKRKDEEPLFLYDIDDAVTKIGDIYGN